MDLKRSKNGKEARNFLENGSSTFVGPCIREQAQIKVTLMTPVRFLHRFIMYRFPQTQQARSCGLQLETKPSESTD